MITRATLNDSIFRMNARGGYILAFVKSVAHDIPDITWAELRNRLTANGSMCGYHPDVVRRSFGR